jgi:hypothetical protein
MAATGEQVAERAKAQMLRMDKSCMFAMITWAPKRDGGLVKVMGK